MNKFERRDMFERLVDLRTVRRLSGDDRRVIPADGWAPDTSILDPVGAAITDGLAKIAANRDASTAAYAAATERWYAGNWKDCPHGGVFRGETCQKCGTYVL